MPILLFIIILAFLVIIHELGHFLVARRYRMKVEEFGLGYPPRIKILKTDTHGTDFTLNWLPFGGFVRIFGEDSFQEVPKDKVKGAFFNKPLYQRIAVVLAGASVNFLFGAAAFGIIYTIIGIPTQYTLAKIESVVPGSPAALAGLVAGDEITAVIIGSETKPIRSSNDFVAVVGNEGGKTIQLVLNDRPGPVDVYVRSKEEIPENQGAVGVVVSDYELKRYPLWQMPFRGMAYGIKTAVEFGILLIKALGGMISGAFQGQVPQDVAGPVGIAYMVQKQGILSGSWLQKLNFAAILSINLAIVNVLPIPALDGGRLVFLYYEGISKKRAKPEFERKVNTVGFLALVLLLILISIKDVTMVAKDQGLQMWFQGLFK